MIGHFHGHHYLFFPDEINKAIKRYTANATAAVVENKLKKEKYFSDKYTKADIQNNSNLTNSLSNNISSLNSLINNALQNINTEQNSVNNSQNAIKNLEPVNIVNSASSNSFNELKPKDLNMNKTSPAADFNAENETKRQTSMQQAINKAIEENQELGDIVEVTDEFNKVSNSIDLSPKENISDKIQNQPTFDVDQINQTVTPSNSQNNNVTNKPINSLDQFEYNGFNYTTPNQMNKVNTVKFTSPLPLSNEIKNENLSFSTLDQAINKEILKGNTLNNINGENKQQSNKKSLINLDEFNFTPSSLNNDENKNSSQSSLNSKIKNSYINNDIIEINGEKISKKELVKEIENTLKAEQKINNDLIKKSTANIGGMKAVNVDKFLKEKDELSQKTKINENKSESTDKKSALINSLKNTIINEMKNSIQNSHKDELEVFESQNTNEKALTSILIDNRELLPKGDGKQISTGDYIGGKIEPGTKEDVDFISLLQSKQLTSKTYSILLDYAKNNNLNMNDLIKTYKSLSGNDLNKFILQIYGHSTSESFNNSEIVEYAENSTVSTINKSIERKINESDIDDLF